MTIFKTGTALQGSLALALLLTGVTGPLVATAAEQEEDGLMLEEITVTARRVSENLQSVPVSVSAFGKNYLENNAVDNLGDIQNKVPNLTLHVGDASNAVVYIRGVGQVDSLAFADPGVGIYLDDVYMGRAQGAFLDVFEAERIEVLRGPQGTLYGRNTIGGAVKFVSARPTEELSAHASVTAGSYKRLDVKAGISGPISGDRLLGKIDGAVLSRDGYADNLASGEDDGDKESWALRGSLLFRASDNVEVTLSVDGSENHSDTSRTPARMTDVFGVPASTDPFEIEADFNDLNELDVYGIAGSIDWEVNENLSLKSVTAWRQMNYRTHLDLDATEFAFFGVYVDEDQEQFSQELQLSYVSDRLELVGGLYYFHETDVTLSGIYGPVIAFVSGSVNDQTNNSYAAFANLNYNVTDQLSVTAGLRYTHETKDFLRVQEFFAADQMLPVPIGEGFRVTDVDVNDNWSSLSPKIGLDYQVSEDLMVYASASRGFKSGGFDGRSNSADQAVSYDPETMWAYEAGLKSTLANGRVMLNLAGFINKYKDLQLSSFVADGEGAFSALFTNAGRATIMGLEAELTARPMEELTLQGSLGYMDAQYDEYIGPGGDDISDSRHMVNSPEWTAHAAFTYERDISDDLLLRVIGDLAWRSKTYPTVSSSEILAQDGYALINASVALSRQEGVWEVALQGKNLTDKRYVSHGFDLSDSLGYQLGYYGDPRTWAVSLKLRY